MKILNRYIIVLTVLMLIRLPVYAQSSQRFSNSFRVHYGLYQYNSNKNEFLSEGNKNFLNAGLTYRRQLGRITGLNLTGRYYKWQLKDSSALESYATQAMFVLHAKRVGSNRHLSRFTPYLGAGIGIQKHDLNYKTGGDTAFVKLYIPFEAGIFFNISKRWSIGVFAEYKISSSTDIKNLSKTTEGKLDIVNTAGVSLAWHFGKKKTVKFKAPVVYTNPNLKETKSKQAQNPAYKKIIKPSPVDSVKNIFPKEKPPILKDSVKKIINSKNDSIQSVPDTISQKINKAKKQEKLISQIDTSARFSKIQKVDSIVIVKDSIAVVMDSVSKKTTAKNPGTVKSSKAKVQKTTDSIVKKKDTIAVAKDSAVKEITANKSDAVKSSKAKVQKTVDSVISKEPTKATLPIKDSVVKKTALKDSGKKDLSNKQDTRNPIPMDAKKENPETQLNNSEKIDSLMSAIKQMNQRMDQRLNSNPETVIRKDTIIIVPIETNKTEDPLITELKQSYNKMGELIDINYKKGNLSESELDSIRLEADRIKANFTVLADENEVIFDEISVIYNAISDLQIDMDIEKSEIARINTGSLQKEVIMLRNERDSALLELEKLKKKTRVVEKDSVRTAVKANVKKEPVQKTEVQKKPALPEINDSTVKAEALESYTINFDVNSFVIRTFHKKELAKIATKIKSGDDMQILLTGFSDKSGNTDYNKKLTQRRLLAVKKELIELGIKKESILEKNFGSERSMDELNINERKVVIQVLPK